MFLKFVFLICGALLYDFIEGNRYGYIEWLLYCRLKKRFAHLLFHWLLNEAARVKVIKYNSGNFNLAQAPFCRYSTHYLSLFHLVCFQFIPLSVFLCKTVINFFLSAFDYPVRLIFVVNFAALLYFS